MHGRLTHTETVKQKVILYKRDVLNKMELEKQKCNGYLHVRLKVEEYGYQDVASPPDYVMLSKVK